MHLVQTKKRYISEAEISGLAEGDTWFIDSNEGESINVVVTAVTYDAFYLESIDPNSFAFARLEREDIPKMLYEPIPENPTFH